HDGARAAEVVDGDGVAGSGCGIEKDDRQVARPQLFDRGKSDVGSHDHQPVDAAAHRLDDFQHFAGIAVRTGNEDVVPLATCRQIDAANDFREEFAMNVGKDDANG